MCHGHTARYIKEASERICTCLKKDLSPLFTESLDRAWNSPLERCPAEVLFNISHKLNWKGLQAFLAAAAAGNLQAAWWDL